MPTLSNLRFTAFLSLTLVAPIVATAESNIYNSIPATLPPNVVSQAFQATQTAEFGFQVGFAPGTGRFLTSATLTMSNWSAQSQYAGFGDANGYQLPLTLNLYNVAPGNNVGSLISSQTINASILWRPEHGSSGCPEQIQWRASDGNCYHGLAQNVTFAFDYVPVPDNLIYGLQFNTESWGPNPTGVDGPYDGLNFGFSNATPDGQVAQPSVGTDPAPDSAYWNTSNASNYTDLGAGGTGTFRQDTGWTGYDGSIAFGAEEAVPEPGTVGMMGLGLAGLVWGSRKRFAGKVA